MGGTFQRVPQASEEIAREARKPEILQEETEGTESVYSCPGQSNVSG